MHDKTVYEITFFQHPSLFFYFFFFFFADVKMLKSFQHELPSTTTCEIGRIKETWKTFVQDASAYSTKLTYSIRL